LIAAMVLLWLWICPGRASAITLEEARNLILEYADAEGVSQADRAKALDSLKRLSEVIPPEQAYKIVFAALQTRKSVAPKKERETENRQGPDKKSVDTHSADTNDAPSKSTEVPARADQREDKPPSRTANKEHDVRSSGEKMHENSVASKKSEKCWIIENSLKGNRVKPVPIVEPVLIRPALGIDECAQE